MSRSFYEKIRIDSGGAGSGGWNGVCVWNMQKMPKIVLW